MMGFEQQQIILGAYINFHWADFLSLIGKALIADDGLWNAKMGI